MMYDIDLLKDELIKIIEEDEKKYPISYAFELGNGVYFVLDCLTKITGVDFSNKIT